MLCHSDSTDRKVWEVPLPSAVASWGLLAPGVVPCGTLGPPVLDLICSLPALS